MRTALLAIWGLCCASAAWAQVWGGQWQDLDTAPGSTLWLGLQRADFRHRPGSGSLDWSDWAGSVMFSQPNLDLFLCWQPRAGDRGLEYWEAGGHFWNALPLRFRAALELPFGLFAGYRSVGPSGAMHDGVSVSVLALGAGLAWRLPVGSRLPSILRLVPFGGLAFEPLGLQTGGAGGLVAEARLHTPRLMRSRYALGLGIGYRYWRWYFDVDRLNYTWSDVRFSVGLSF
jgi:hypothetical protein